MAPRDRQESEPAGAQGLKVVVTLIKAGVAWPAARGRTWTDEDFVARDVVLAGLGLRPFGQRHMAECGAEGTASMRSSDEPPEPQRPLRPVPGGLRNAEHEENDDEDRHSLQCEQGEAADAVTQRGIPRGHPGRDPQRPGPKRERR